MKVIVNGKELEIDTNIIPGEKDYQEKKKTETNIDLENTVELSEEEIEKIEKEAEHE